MTHSEANKIFQIWKEWYWPIHTILHSIFFSNIPKSFLPFPVDVLEKALNIIAKDYHDKGDYKMSKNIQESLTSTIAYVDDKEAIQNAVKNFSEPEFIKLRLEMISNYKKDWGDWLKKT